MSAPSGPLESGTKATRALLVALVLLTAAAGPVPAAADQPMIGEPAPGFRLAALDGSSVDLADLRGKTVVLHFGAGW